MSRRIFSDSKYTARLARDGHVVVDLLPLAAVESLHEAYASTTGPRKGFSSTIMSRDTEHREAVDGAIRRLIEEPLRALIHGHRVAFCTFVAKAPADAQSEVRIHQDWSFVDESRFSALGVWCPLVDVGTGNGCLQVVGGSHMLTHFPRPACTPFAYRELEGELRRCLSELPMRAGQALVFDQRLFHCSPPNLSSTERIAATAVLVPDEAPLRYYHVVDPDDASTVEVFEVPDTFYLQHIPGTRPRSAKSLGVFALRDLGAFAFSLE